MADRPAPGEGLFGVPGTGIVIRPVDERDMTALLAVYRQCEDFLSPTLNLNYAPAWPDAGERRTALHGSSYMRRPRV